MDKFKLYRQPLQYTTGTRGKPVRVSADTYNILVELSNDTGLSMASCANKAIAYAYENLEYITVEAQ